MQIEIINEIAAQRKSGAPFRKISEIIKERFNVSISHSKIAAMCKDTERGEAKEQGAAQEQEQGLAMLDISQERINEILQDLRQPEKRMALDLVLRAQAYALVEANIKAHIAGEARLNKEYLTYYKELSK